MHGLPLYETNRAVREIRSAQLVDRLHAEALVRNELTRYARMQAEASDYYALCERAHRYGIDYAAIVEGEFVIGQVAQLRELVEAYRPA